MVLLAFVTFGLTLLIAVLLFIKLAATEIVVTDRRFIYKHGWLFQRVHEINLPKVEGVRIRKSIFGYGTVNVHGTGAGDITIPGIAEPFALRSAIQNLSPSAVGPMTASEVTGTKPCPRCAETVKQAAQICRFCGHEFIVGDTPKLAAPAGCPIDPYDLARTSPQRLDAELNSLSTAELIRTASLCGMDGAGHLARWKREDILVQIRREALRRVDAEQTR